MEINQAQQYVIVEAGIFLGDLKKHLREHDLFYPPSPTSEDIAMLGGTLATNASGASSFKYGPTANYVLELEVALADGTLISVKNSESPKVAAGPFAFKRPTNIWVGSEGIFGVITKAKLRLLKGIPEFIGLLTFFKSLEDAMRFTHKAAATRHLKHTRALEFLDNACLKLLREEGKFSQVPEAAQIAILIEHEIGANTQETALDRWLTLLEKNSALLDATLVANSAAKRAELKALRHFIPSALNEKGLRAKANGGKKIATDWAVPVKNLAQMVKDAEACTLKAGFTHNQIFRFGHIGDGHPHYNIIANNKDELIKAEKLREDLAKLALSYGGTVSAEHGIGKLRKHLLNLEISPLKLRALKALKHELDPNDIMAPGNILDSNLSNS